MFDELMEKIDARPDNFGAMKDASGHAKITGPCGDTVEIWLRIDGGKIRKATFMSDGCGHSAACCGTAARMTEGLRTKEAAEISQAEILKTVGPVPEDHRHCALLAANTIKKAVADYIEKPAKQSLKQKLKQLFKPRTPEKNHA
jgi:nitrogen fixation protein NifU and related proteins